MFHYLRPCKVGDNPEVEYIEIEKDRVDVLFCHDLTEIQWATPKVNWLT
jgi:hypothetical protein